MGHMSIAKVEGGGGGPVPANQTPGDKISWDEVSDRTCSFPTKMKMAELSGASSAWLWKSAGLLFLIWSLLIEILSDYLGFLLWPQYLHAADEGASLLKFGPCGNLASSQRLSSSLFYRPADFHLFQRQRDEVFLGEMDSLWDPPRW